jgi:hypothetical protein
MLRTVTVVDYQKQNDPKIGLPIFNEIFRLCATGEVLHHFIYGVHIIQNTPTYSGTENILAKGQRENAVLHYYLHVV